MDPEGPVPLDDDNTVVVKELPDFLSEEERATLRQCIVLQDSLSDEWMVQNFIVIRNVVHSPSQ